LINEFNKKEVFPMTEVNEGNDNLTNKQLRDQEAAAKKETRDQEALAKKQLRDQEAAVKRQNRDGNDNQDK
jgi:hypothetical protein